MYAYILLGSTNRVLRAEKLLRAAAIESKMVPIPRHISSDCGVCLRVEQSRAEAVRRILEEASLEVEGVYEG